MHVLILNQTFHPDIAATAQHMWDLARYLDERGHRVTVLSSRVYYGTDRLHDNAVDHYGRRVTVHRVAGTRFGKSSRAGLFGRMSDFASFYAAAAAKLRALPTPDVILALTSPPMIASLAAAWVGTRKRLGRPAPKLVYHVMDLYPDAAVASGVLRDGSLAARLLSRVTARTMAACDGVVALGRDMRRRILDRSGPALDPARVHVITPWADGADLSPLPRSQNPLAQSLGLADTFNVVYSGNLGIAHDVDTIAHGIQMTLNHPRLRWVFIGGGKRFDELRRMGEERGWTHFRVLPFQPREDLNATLNLADVHLVSQLPAFTGVVVPSKLFGILAVGRPSVMVGPTDAECARIIAERDAGVVIPNGDAAGLVAALNRLADDPDLRQAMGRRARQAFELKYDAAVTCARLELVLAHTLNRGTPARPS